MALFNHAETTAKGHALLHKVLSGRTKFKFTKIQTGDGHFDGKVSELTALIGPRIDGKIVGLREGGQFSQIDGYINNQDLTEFMEFREIGVFAQDPDEGEILFSYSNAQEHASPIGPFNGTWLHEESFTIRVYTANATDIQAEISPTAFAAEIRFDNTGTGLNATNLQDSVTELKSMLNGQTVNAHDLVHDHNQDPNAHSDRFAHLQSRLETLSKVGTIELSESSIPNNGTILHKKIISPFTGFLPNGQRITGESTPPADPSYPTWNGEYNWDGTLNWSGEHVVGEKI